MSQSNGTVRDEGGRFAAGTRGGPGNPFNRQVAALRKAAVAAVSEEDIAAIMQALVAKAKKGDTAAARLVLSYAVGKPQPAPPPDRMDVEEWQCFKDVAGMLGEMPEVMAAPGSELPIELVRITRQDMVNSWKKRLHAGVFGEVRSQNAEVRSENGGKKEEGGTNGLMGGRFGKGAARGSHEEAQEAQGLGEVGSQSAEVRSEEVVLANGVYR